MHAVREAPARAETLGNDVVNCILGTGVRRQGPSVSGGVGGDEGAAGEAANTTANGQAKVDMGGLVEMGLTEREAGMDVEGEVGDAKCTSVTHRGGFKARGEGKASASIAGQCTPLLLPLGEVAMLLYPWRQRDTWVADLEAIII